MTFTYVPAIDLRDEISPTYFSVTLNSGRTVDVVDADTYQPEGPLTTFFRTGSSSPTIDVWSERVASFRTSDIASIHQCSFERPVHPSAQNLGSDDGSGSRRSGSANAGAHDRSHLSLVSA